MYHFLVYIQGPRASRMTSELFKESIAKRTIYEHKVVFMSVQYTQHYLQRVVYIYIYIAVPHRQLFTNWIACSTNNYTHTVSNCCANRHQRAGNNTKQDRNDCLLYNHLPSRHAEARPFGVVVACMTRSHTTLITPTIHIHSHSHSHSHTLTRTGTRT